MKVEALNCPNCGAGVASDHTQCEFCQTRLKTMGCPTCMGLMFVGTQYCGHCGAKMVLAAVHEGDGLGECPRCKTKLDHLSIGSTNFRECSKCDGLWSNVEDFERLCATREEQSAVLGFMGDRERKIESISTIKYVPCPDCRQLMNRSNFARASGIIIDVCKKHGVWFDADELPKIVEFIQKGGMEIARQREKMEIRDERDRLREERRKQAAQDQRFGLGNVWDKKDENDGIRSFIQNLFD
ncbi:MAG: zf-TFIIB domain-containing protein [Pyrinomonadaceae bacterium]|nr:zf-TFIIB domain-containing protein [Pyrinomonadaceae bacterium]